MNEESVAKAASELIDAEEALIAGLLKHGIDTWEKVEQHGLDPDPDRGHFRQVWKIRVGR